ncbi:MAG: integrin alpha [Planctomycetota bacterium]|jgi:hypothetical protein
MKGKITVIIMLVLFSFGHLNGQIIQIFDHQKISDTQGNFTGTLNNEDIFGSASCTLGDLDGDGVEDIAVGARHDDDGGEDTGAVWILFLNMDGTVKSHQKISDTAGGFTGTIDNIDRFGGSLASLGDFDGDGIIDIAVGAYSDDDGGFNRGAVWILFLNTNGTVKSHQKISDTIGGFTGALSNSDLFGFSVACLGDLDGDNINDLAVGARNDDDGGTNRGAIWILFLNSNGTVKSHQKISDTAGGFTGTLIDTDYFGCEVCPIGDLDGDDVNDIAVGAYSDDDGGYYRGAAWVLFLNSNGTVKSHQKISDTQGGFSGTLDDIDNFGRGLYPLGDIDGDGIMDIAVGAHGDDDGGIDRGAVWFLYLNTDGTVKNHQKISDTQGGFGGDLDDSDYFGYAISKLEDLNGDGFADLAVSAFYDDDGGIDKGAVWILFLSRLEFVNIDIKPTSCPNPLNVKSKGKLPVAILGSEDLDVYDIDAVSVRLEGVEAIRSSYEDVASPAIDINDCNCTTDGPDGHVDLTLKFPTEDIVDAIGEINDVNEFILKLDGLLYDNTIIEGYDCVKTVGKHKPPKQSDLNEDDVVNMEDFAIMASEWLK